MPLPSAEFFPFPSLSPAGFLKSEERLSEGEKRECGLADEVVLNSSTVLWENCEMFRTTWPVRQMLSTWGQRPNDGRTTGCLFFFLDYFSFHSKWMIFAASLLLPVVFTVPLGVQLQWGHTLGLWTPSGLSLLVLTLQVNTHLWRAARQILPFCIWLLPQED